MSIAQFYVMETCVFTLTVRVDATTQMSDNRLLVGDSSAQLYQAQLGTNPGRWNRKRDEREGIAVGPEVRKRCSRLQLHLQHLRQDPMKRDQGTQLGPSGRESSCNVGDPDAINRAIGRRQQGDRLAKGDYLRGAQQRVRADRENDAQECARDDGANAS